MSLIPIFFSAITRVKMEETDNLINECYSLRACKIETNKVIAFRTLVKLYNSPFKSHL